MSLPILEQSMSRPSSGAPSPRKVRSRTQSLSSDRPSTLMSHSFMASPMSVDPEACFIASSAASQIVTNHHDSHADTWYDQIGIEPSGEVALVSRAALRSLNAFLDQLLLNFLNISKSTSLAALRPAVSDVLKPKLAKDAINQADDELHEYLGGGDLDDIVPGPSSKSGRDKDWDVELAWKRARLRCMVYSSLGDLEEEDEDYYTEHEHLDAGLESGLADLVSPAVAIFLTSILEFIGEQALIISGQAAYNRMRVKYEQGLKEGTRSPGDTAERIVVEELDMERVALDRSLGRLWRAWKKKARLINSDKGASRHSSRDSTLTVPGGHTRHLSLPTESASPLTVREPVCEGAQENHQPTRMPVGCGPPDELQLAASISLPIGDRDVEEIETPWLVDYSDDDDEKTEEDPIKSKRPRSLVALSFAVVGDSSAQASLQFRAAARARSKSLPPSSVSPYASDAGRQRAATTGADIPSVAELNIAIPARTDLILESGAGSTDKNNTNRAEGAESSTRAPPTTTHVEDVAGIAMPHPPHPLQPNRASAIILGAVAIGNAALDGMASVAKGSALQTDPEPSDSEEDAAVEEFTEEPQILTSSRVSLSGRSTSPTVSEHGRPASVVLNPSVRPPSTHSLRLIELPGPRSPSTRSTKSFSGSFDTNDRSRSNTATTSSVTTPPIVEETRPTATDPFPDEGLAGRAHTQRRAEENIRLAEPEAPVAAHSVAVLPPASDSVVPVAPPGSESGLAGLFDVMTSRVHASEPVLGSGSVLPGSPLRPPPTKSPVATQTVHREPSGYSTPTSFLMDDETDVPEQQADRPGTHPLPAPDVPERSSNRKADVATPTRSSPHAVSIGIVSVERLQDQPARGSRQLHTSGSSSTASANKSRLVRTSEDSANSKVDVVRNFEQLIHSDQTIQYTLTPESMRNMEPQSPITPTSPLAPARTRRSEEERAANDRPRSSANRETTSIRPCPANEAQVDGNTTTGFVPRPTPTEPSGPHADISQAKDASLPRQPVAEFAESTRSTGPPKEAGSTRGSTFVRATGVSSASAASIVSRQGSILARANRAGLQAREAAVGRRDDNSDLIDFIRQGPPSAAGNRIPRSVAPFRNTMDSDQMSSAVGGRAVDAQIRDVDIRGSESSTIITDYSMPSVQSSCVNSTTGLLRKKSLSAQTASRMGVRDGDVPVPQRKSRRARDPCSIDLSDDEHEGSQPGRAPAQEESLADFLKNYAPPPEPTVQPLAISQMQNRPKKKASASSLIARFTRRDGSQSGTQAVKGGAGAKSVKAAFDTRSVNSRAGGGRGFVPLQVNMPPGVDRYNPSYGSPKVASTESKALPNASGGVRMKYEPRDAISVPLRTATSDLADFLRNSEPPPPTNVPEAYRKKSSWNTRVFTSRRKPSTG